MRGPHDARTQTLLTRALSDKITAMQPPGDILAAMRRAAGLSQRALAQRGGTSAPTIAAYEAGDKEPRLTTLDRLAGAAGFRVRLEVEPVSTTNLQRTDRRSLALHGRVFDHLLRDPEAVREIARRNLRVMGEANPEAGPWLQEWARLLDGPLHELAAVLLSTNQHACGLRRCTPFAGVLAQDERLEVLRSLG
jgi:transcriptional regulator with XRE-family HTH domain